MSEEINDEQANAEKQEKTTELSEDQLDQVTGAAGDEIELDWAFYERKLTGASADRATEGNGEVSKATDIGSSGQDG